MLVVQRTGWGKSSVYFICTRILRDRGAGPTVIVSPLLASMRNQIDAAERLRIKTVTINSIQPGLLVRESLSLQTMRLKDQSARLAWLAQRIPELHGTVIVYVLTIRDAEQVATWLSQQEITARAYHGSVRLYW